MKTSRKIPDEIEFNRPQKYKFIKELGKGACGETILVEDAEFRKLFVIKKFKPIITKSHDPKFYYSLQKRFRKEAEILFDSNHENIVRVFNYFEYKERDTAYILMEYVKGNDFFSHFKIFPENINETFEKIISGFCYLEEKSILHRDIRPGNILVDEKGSPKIIDFGFGKEISKLTQENRSVSLNWFTNPPEEISRGVYDTKSEIYFVGKLFEIAIKSSSIDSFEYEPIVRSMIISEHESRISSFSEIKNKISAQEFSEQKFSDIEIRIYRNFIGEIANSLNTIYLEAKYNSDFEKILHDLNQFYLDCMLEEIVPDNSRVIRIFVNGGFSYNPYTQIYTDTIKDFNNFIKNLGGDRKSIVLRNIFSRLDSIERKAPKSNMDDDIPF